MGSSLGVPYKRSCHKCSLGMLSELKCSLGCPWFPETSMSDIDITALQQRVGLETAVAVAVVGPPKLDSRVLKATF